MTLPDQNRSKHCRKSSIEIEYPWHLLLRFNQLYSSSYLYRILQAAADSRVPMLRPLTGYLDRGLWQARYLRIALMTSLDTDELILRIDDTPCLRVQALAQHRLRRFR